MDDYLKPLQALRAAVLAKRAAEVPAPPKVALTVFVTKEPFTDFFTLHIPDGKGGWNPQEELDVDDTYEWFRARGAEMESLEKALDHVWNFNKGAFQIDDFHEPPVKNPRMQPKID